MSKGSRMTDRERDEMALRMLSMRYEGHNMRHISEKLDVSWLTVRNWTGRVRKADDDHDPGASGYYG